MKFLVSMDTDYSVLRMVLVVGTCLKNLVGNSVSKRCYGYVASIIMSLFPGPLGERGPGSH